MKYLIEAGYLSYCVLESFWHAKLIKANLPIKHALWFWAYFMLSILVVFVDGTWKQRLFFLLSIWLIREIIHSPVLNFLRHKPFFYSDSSPQGSTLDNIEGAAIPFIYVVSLIGFIILQFFL